MTTYRVYFNRASDAPQVWSVDEGTQATEITVIGIRLEGADAITRVLPPDTPVDPDRAPRAWLEVRGKLQIRAGVAIFMTRLP
ncbi:MAG TPA: hypothetical protein VE714_12630 [Gemmatimonadales bacterium]|jgi:hypothetical protein|nr:hypothetical protein [Gemmatimonadales bacterium]